ncbi:methyltransferase family protein, partial [Cupriavidus sp. 2MCAB6]|uniref:methyltransferase family protein n=1 Tax=Cupriavidus sp. 2MCAB6 TaxID=3232981 RepID=UPI003F912832
MRPWVAISTKGEPRAFPTRGLMRRGLRPPVLGSASPGAVVSPGAIPTSTRAIMSGLDPSHIMQVGMGFFASKTLLSAVELGLFTTLAKQPMTA